MLAKIFGSKEMRLLMLGLDAAGKTSKRAPRYDWQPVWTQIQIVHKSALVVDYQTRGNQLTDQFSPSHSLQAQARQRCHHNPYSRLQRRNSDLQEHQIQRLGRRRTRQDPSSLEALLFRYATPIRKTHSIPSETSRFGPHDIYKSTSTNNPPGTQGLIFVIDSNDRDRIEEARSELTRIIQDREMKDALLLVFANKQDIPGCMKPKEVSDALNLGVVAKDHTWKVEPSCATTGEGIFEGLAWLSSHVQTPAK